jgi:hypothetical protein
MGQGEMQQMCGGVENLEEWVVSLRSWAADNEVPMPHKIRLEALIETARERMAAVEMLKKPS